MQNQNQSKAAAPGAQPVEKVIGLVAGEGKLPAILAKSAKERGYRVVALALSPEAQARVIAHCDKVFVIAIGQVTRNLNLVKQEGISDLVFTGKVPKTALLKNIYKLDWMAMKELSKLPDFEDDTIQRATGDFLNEHGLRVLPQATFLKQLFPEVGVMTKRQPTAAEYADIEFGFKRAKEIARLEIGQTIVIRNQMIVAVEGIEGTDQAIKRGVALAHGPVVVVKVARPNQDQRFDIPAVGLTTLESMVASKPRPRN